MRNIRAGFVGFGEVNTPREIIRRKCDEARRLLEAEGVELVWTEPVSDDPQGKDVARAGAELAAAEFDLLIVCVAGWIPSHAVIDVVDRFKHKPMLLWGLTGWSEGGSGRSTGWGSSRWCSTWGSSPRARGSAL